MDSLYSCMIIESDYALVDVELFSYGLSQGVPGGNCNATRAHTNVPRSGHVGLPMHWDMFVYRWRFQTNVRLDEPVLDWAAETHATLVYHDKPESSLPVMALLMAPQDFSMPIDLLEFATDMPGGPERSRPFTNRRDGGPGSGAPLWLRENLSYSVRVQTHPKANQELQKYLVAHTNSGRMLLWCYFDGLLRKDVR